MHHRASSLALLFFVGFMFVPHLAFAGANGGVPFFGPIVPPAGQACAAGFGLLMQVVNNIISFLLTLAIVFVAPLSLAWAGFLMVVNVGDSGRISQAKGIITNTVVGIVIALAGWLIVDAIMAVLYNPSAATGQTKLGAWTSLVTGSGNACLLQEGAIKDLTQGTPPTGGGVTTTAGGNGIDTSNVQLQMSVTDPSIVTILSCMSNKLTTGKGIVTALTDSYVGANADLIAHCDSVGSGGDSKCVHTANSCHYGGSCGGKSYAADISGPTQAIEQAAMACDPQAWINNEGNHVHVSTGRENGCGCDLSASNNL